MSPGRRQQGFKFRESDLLRLGEDDETQKNVHVNARRTSAKNKDQNKRPLDPNHKYFLIIDDEDTGGETLEGRDLRVHPISP